MQELNEEQHDSSFHGWRNAFVSILLFFMLWEWLRTFIEMSYMTDLYIIQPFLVAIASFLFIDYVRCPGWIAWLIKLFVCVSIIGYFFHESLLLDWHWWRQYISISLQDGLALLQGDFWQISAENRTLLFLVGCSFIIFVVQSLMMNRQSGGFFICATLVYLIALQLLIGLDTTAGVMRSFGLGLILLVVLNGSKIKQRYRASSQMPAALWWVVSLIIISGSMTTGVYLSQSAAVEIQSINWEKLSRFEWFSDSSIDLSVSENVHTKSGYSFDDSRLGGSLEQDDAIVFTAKTDALTYWRGEAKSYYNGKGWTQPVFQSAGFSNGTFDVGYPGKFAEQEILFSEPRKYNIFFTGGLISEFQGILIEDGRQLSDHDVNVDALSGKYSIKSSELLSYYKMKVVLPLSEADLPQNELMQGEAISTWQAELLAPYLQLPDNLPQRIKELAIQVVGDTAQPYEKANSLAQYLQNHYEYNLDQPAYPRSDQDFVDHFLFEQKLGYCDHFSSAMVIMLRSLGIPARWVKGYSPGELQPPDLEASQNVQTHTVVVRNLHAHSWVEVYFPEIGWVSFDPTPSDLADIKPANQTISNQGAPMKFHKTFAFRITLLLFAAVLLVTIVLWNFRKDLFIWHMMRKITKLGKRPEVIHKLFDSLWLTIFHHFGTIHPSQTIREYVQGLNIRDEEQRHALLAFAKMYEFTRYNSTEQQGYQSQEVLRIWKKIIH